MRTRGGLTVGIWAVLTIGLVGCSDSAATGPGGGSLDEEFVVRGSVQNNTQSEIPSSARVLIAWSVSSTSPDYSYVFGEGTIDSSDGTFEVVLEAEPPTAALNAGALGVGVIAVTTSAGVSTGDDMSDVPEEQIIGAAGEYGVIYVEDASTAGEVRGWAADFDSGYGVGVGGPEEQGYETFVPTDASGVELIIDDLDDIDFVNWT